MDISGSSSSSSSSKTSAFEQRLMAHYGLNATEASAEPARSADPCSPCDTPSGQAQAQPQTLSAVPMDGHPLADGAKDEADETPIESAPVVPLQEAHREPTSGYCALF